MMRISERRKRRQGGQEIIEFAFTFLLLGPLLVGGVYTGLALVRTIQATHVCRDLDDIYIHGGDFSTYPMQQLAQKLSSGLNLQIGASFNGNQRANTGNGGSGLVTVSQIQWIGSTTDPTCKAVAPAICANHDSFVFTEQVQFGNGTLNGPNATALGNPTTTSISNAGKILGSLALDSGAKVPDPGQSRLQSLWQVSGGNRTPLVDGQVVYVVETYFSSPAGTPVYARWFF